MNVHKNARLTPHRRVELVGRISSGERVIEVAGRLGVSRRTVYKWIVRYRAEGPAGQADRSSRPHSSPRRTAAAIALGMKVLRMQRWTCAEIAHAVGVSAPTAARVLRRAGLSRRGRGRASRTFMATLVPREREAEFFGFYALVGKTGAVLGPVVFGGVSWLLSGNQRAAIVVVGFFFVAGFLLVGRVDAGGPLDRPGSAAPRAT